MSSSRDDLLSLQPADEADDDAADEQVQAGVEEDLLEQLRREKSRGFLRGLVEPSGSHRVPAFPATAPAPARWPLPWLSSFRPWTARVRADADLDGPGVVAGLVGHVSERIHPPVAQPRHQVQRHQASRDLHDGQHHRHVGVVRDLPAASTPTQVTKVPAESDP